MLVGGGFRWVLLTRDARQSQSRRKCEQYWLEVEGGRCRLADLVDKLKDVEMGEKDGAARGETAVRDRNSEIGGQLAEAAVKGRERQSEVGRLVDAEWEDMHVVVLPSWGEQSSCAQV